MNHNQYWKMIFFSSPVRLIAFSLLIFAYPVTASATDTNNKKNLFINQIELINSQLNHLADNRQNINDFYFVGFSPYAEEDVFMHEATYVRNLFDLQYDTLNRSILLVNNLKTLDIYPIASLKNLESAMNRISSIIDPEEDIVVLYITSHGSQDHRILMNFDEAKRSGLNIEDIDAKTIKRLFEKNNIKWRVILILACFSGGFIDTLKNENTLIITSANIDRASFGCGHHGDFTQFGKAFFKDNLNHSKDLISAFEHTRSQVETLEKKLDFRPSQPQIFIGENIRPILNRLMHEN